MCEFYFNYKNPVSSVHFMAYLLEVWTLEKYLNFNSVTSCLSEWSFTYLETQALPQLCVKKFRKSLSVQYFWQLWVYLVSRNHGEKTHYSLPVQSLFCNKWNNSKNSKQFSTKNNILKWISLLTCQLVLL